MPDITKTISLLDELRGKIKENNHAENWDTDETFGGDAVIVKRHEFETGMKGTEVLFEGDWGEAEDAAYIVALHNSYEALRQAALDGERYRKAGGTIENLIKEGNPWQKYLCELHQGFAPDCEDCSLAAEVVVALNKYEEALLLAYRQAVE